MISPPPLAGTPKEAIKDSTPADITADDDAELEEAIEDGTKTDEAMAKAKVKSKSHILGAFRSVGKKMAGFKGDVAVDGARKQVSLVRTQNSSPFVLIVHCPKVWDSGTPLV